MAGDILNTFQLDESHVGLYLLDVSGHGVQAALLSVTLSRILTPLADQRTLVRRRAADGASWEPTPPAEVVAELNRRFQVNEETAQYFTIHYSVLNTKTHELRSVGAGHPGPVYLPADGKPEILKPRSFPVGWVRDVVYEEHHMRLNPGDRIYLYSDGIVEVRNAERVQFGDERLIRTLPQNRGTSLRESLENLVRAATSWSDGPFDDDVSGLSIEITEAGR